MPAASFDRSSFLGGLWSKFAQGRTDRPDYVTALNECLNAYPSESGVWVRRPGFRFAATTRGGVKGRVIKFDFQQNAPYQFELTDGHVRFFSGAVLATTNDSVTVLAISAANPAVAQTSAAVTWATGDQAFFSLLGTGTPLLQNRIFALTKVDTTHFSLADAVTGTTINGSTLGALAAGATINRVLDIATPYTIGIWAGLRSIQTESTAFLLVNSIQPYAITVLSQPTALATASFALKPAVFNDGPYLDPFTNGVQANPNQLTGVVTITLSFPQWVATTAYSVGAFVTKTAINYQSLVDQNVGSSPPSANWAAVSAGAAINNGQGFLATDIGRLVRLFSEPDIWLTGTSYNVGSIVSYNPSGIPGGNTYWTSLTGPGNTGNIPGVDLTHWSLTPANAAVWTWGKIISLANAISGTLAGSTNIGNMTSLLAAFDGVNSKPAVSCAFLNQNASLIDASVGKNYTGASAQQIGNATIYPASDLGFMNIGSGGGAPLFSTLVINLRGKATAPVSPADGTLLATVTLGADQTTPVTLASNDQATAWNYVFFEVIAVWTFAVSTNKVTVGQVIFFNPPGTGAGNAINVELLGPPLLYTTPIRTWRLGAYSGTTGYPTCGTYSDGRLWLSGAIPNRVDACVPNGIVSGTGTVNFAPTDQNGQVSAANAISYTFTADGVNPVFWMTPDLQGLICGTKAGEWLITAPTVGGITPLNIAARKVTSIGAANMEPRRTEHTTVFVQKFGRSIMEYFADVFSGKFTGPPLTWKAKNLTIGGIDEIAYQQELTPTLWARVKGVLIGCTYKRDTLMTSQEPTSSGWHRHTLGSGRVVESLSVGPSVGGNIDALTIVSNDLATGIRHVEIATDMLDEGSTLAQAFYLDDAVNPTSTTSSNVTPAPYGGLTLNGLWHLNGKTVQAWIGGLDCGLTDGGVIRDFVVANGSITIPYGDGVSAGSGAGLFTAAFAAAVPLSQMVAGFAYTSDGQIVRPHSPAESGARSGPAFGKVRRVHDFTALLEGTQGVSFGGSFTKLLPAIFRDAGGTTFKVTQQFSGVYWSQDIKDDYSRDGGMVCWRVTRPYICNIAAVGASLETQG